MPDSSMAEESFQRLRLLLWSPGLYDAGGGTHPQDGLTDQYARLADSATGPSLGGRLINQESFNSLGHLDSPRGLVRFRLSYGGIGPRL